ncbi:VOC family protein [Sphingobium sp. H39-3-25]|uniref:VOC family protein n=1 Tax=Sphingobium arseniciresistens TaxID=3030834 RepID=UPI0023BA1D2D|nr:VOC family protein [Sphingobium arseniciresistens]
MAISNLGYLAFNVSNPERWRVLLEDVFGLELVPQSSEALDFRMDAHHHRLSLYAAPTDSLRAMGWEVKSLTALDALAKRLTDLGIRTEAGSAALCSERKVKALYSYTDPHLKANCEIFYGPLVSNTPFSPRYGMSGFKTDDMGLGHIVYWVEDIKAALDFYREVMGFEVSDYISWDGNDAVFLHCNRRHHSLALLAESPGCPAGTLMHIMLETNSIDDVGYAYDRIRDRQFPVKLEPGKHSNDHMQSFYIETPSGFWLEFGTGGREIDENWDVKIYDAPMLWGHRPGGG